VIRRAPPAFPRPDLIMTATGLLEFPEVQGILINASLKLTSIF